MGPKIDPRALVPGTIVYVWFLGVFRHYGVISDRWHDGLPMIYSNSLKDGRAVEITWREFCAGARYFVANYPSHLLPMEVLHNARALSDRPYNPWTWDCQSYVRACHGLPAVSTQGGIVGLLALAAVTALAARS